MSHPEQLCPRGGTLLLRVPPCPPGSCGSAEEPTQSLPPAVSALVCREDSSGLLQCFAGVDTTLPLFAHLRRCVLHPKAVQQSQIQQGPNATHPTPAGRAPKAPQNQQQCSSVQPPHHCIPAELPPHVTLPPTSPLLSANTISNHCVLVHRGVPPCSKGLGSPSATTPQGAIVPKATETGG